MGKWYFLYTFIRGDLFKLWEGKKTFNNEHGSKLYHFLEISGI